MSEAKKNQLVLKPGLVVFDWAGTTIDHGCCAPVLAFMEGFRQRGVTISLEQAREPMGLEKRDHIAAVAAMKAVADQWLEVHGRPVNPADIDAMYEAFVPLLLDALAASSTLIPGVGETVRWLRSRDIKIGASTGYFTEAAEIVARSAASQGYRPDCTICATDVSAGRPQPWMLYHIMEAVQVCPPATVINVGDTVVDVETALNGGVWAVGVARTGNLCGLSLEAFNRLGTPEAETLVERARKELRRAGAHYVIDSVADLPAVVESSTARLAQGETP